MARFFMWLFKWSKRHSDSEDAPQLAAGFFTLRINGMNEWTFLFKAVEIYLGICAGYWLLHRFFVFFPSRKMKKVPSDYGIEHREVFFETADRVRLQGWHLSGNNKPSYPGGRKITIVFFPGCEGTMSKFLPGLKQLTVYGFDVFAFSYRAFGKSGFRWPTEKGVYSDAEAAVNYLAAQKHIEPERLIFYGQSLGCAVACRAALRVRPAALILEAGFPSIPVFMKRFVPWLPLNLLTSSRFDAVSYVSQIHAPVMIVRGSRDKAVSAKQTQMLFDAANEPKTFVNAAGAHAKGLETDPEPYLESIKKFISKVV